MPTVRLKAAVSQMPRSYTCSVARALIAELRNKKIRNSTSNYFVRINEFNVHGSVHRNNILIHIQQDAALHSLFYLETALHVSVGTTTHHQDRTPPT
jgi:hypothetical protein